MNRPSNQLSPALREPNSTTPAAQSTSLIELDAGSDRKGCMRRCPERAREWVPAQVPPAVNAIGWFW